MSSQPRRVGGRTLLDQDPDRLVWILLGRESTDRQKQVDNQLTKLRAFATSIGGRIDREIPENDVSAFKRTRVKLPDGTYGYRVVRPKWEGILTALRKGECNALAVSDIDRAMRDPRTLEDVIDAVELYGVYVASITGNIDLTTDSGISAARSLVNQRNSESRNTSRRVMDGQRDAALEGGNHGGPIRPYGWRKDRVHVNKREVKNLRRELPRIYAGVKPLTLAKEWKAKGIPSVTGKPWRAQTIQDIYLNPRICGYVVYQGEILLDANGDKVKGKWERILEPEEYDAVVAAWRPSEQPQASRLTGRGRGYQTKHLLSPFLRCGKCNARLTGTWRHSRKKGSQEAEEFYVCPAKGQGGCGGLSRAAAPIHEYIKALVIKDQQRTHLEKVEDLPPWPKAGELAGLQKRINDTQTEFEKGKAKVSAARHYASIARMEADEAALLRESRSYERQRQSRIHRIADLGTAWEDPEFTLEQKQAAIAESLIAIIVKPGARGARFHPDQIVPIPTSPDTNTD